MKNKNLLVDDNIESVKTRLETTLDNIKFQKGKVFWDDIEKLQHCIKALENIQIDNAIANKEFEDLLSIVRYQNKY